MESEYLEVLNDLSSYDAKLVAVSKRQPLTKINRLYDLGHRTFGENRVQEFLEKHHLLPRDIDWHLIGHLQSKKVKTIIGKVGLIHSVDRLKLAQTIHQFSQESEVRSRILLQIKIAEEDSKYGYAFEQLVEELKNNTYSPLDQLDICGVMGMATFTENQDQIRQEFKLLKNHFDQLKTLFFSSNDSFSEISMGMSGDYKIALEEGATMVRVGSKLFGVRTY